jgi:hypothetical protein
MNNLQDHKSGEAPKGVREGKRTKKGLVGSDRRIPVSSLRPNGVKKKNP